MALLHWCFLGRVGYSAARVLQNRLAENRSRDESADLLLLLEHPPVLTLGRHAAVPSLPASGATRTIEAPLVRTERGGGLTYHGPGQLVAYPVVRLSGAGRGVRAFVAALEDAMCDVAALHGVTASRRAGFPGVWVSQRGEARKLGSIGLGVRRGVSLHGCALNVDERSELGFHGIVPCGLEGVRVTSLASCGATPPPTIEDASSCFATALAERLGASRSAVRIPASSLAPGEEWVPTERADPDESQRDPGPLLEG